MNEYKDEINLIMWAVKNSFDSNRDYDTELNHAEKIRLVLSGIEIRGQLEGFKRAKEYYQGYSNAQKD